MEKPVPKYQNKPAYDYLEISKYIEDKYKINLRDVKNNKDFWHFLIEQYSIHRGCYITISSEIFISENWQKEILDLFIQEFGDYIYCWVDW